VPGGLSDVACYNSCMARKSKTEAANELIQWHFDVEPELSEIYLVECDDASEQPIRLLEVNAATVATGSIEAFAFAPTTDIPYATVVAEVTPEELKHFLAHPDLLPAGWDLAKAKRYSRRQKAA
jgi:hypothetical protein